MRYIIEDTRTACGVRMIPMTPEVKECFERIVSSRSKSKVESMIDRRCGFYFWIKMRCRWWLCIGRNIFSISVKSTTVFIKCECRVLHLMYADTLAQNLAQMKEKLCKVIPKYADESV